MAVRFLPPPGEDSSSSGGDRADLAEVIELRSLLTHAKWRVPGDEVESPEADSATQGPGTDSEDGHVPTSVAEGSTGESTVVARDLAGTDVPSNIVQGNFPRSIDAAAGEARVDERSPAESVEDAPDLADHALGFAGDTVESAYGDASEPAETRPERSANEDGVRLLARKARSSGELRNELLRLEHHPDEVEDVIDEFERSLYLDDTGLARVLTEKLRESKRASRSQIRTKLRARKLSDSAIESALAELDDDDEYALLRSTAADRARTMRDLDRQTAERRLLGFLARRGWSGEPASRVVREALDGAGGPSRGGAGRGGGVRFR